MPNIYCPSCGTGIKYLYQKPEKCIKCSYVFASISVELDVPEVNKSKKPRSIREEYDDEEDENEFESSSLSNSVRNKFKKIQPKVDIESANCEKIGSVLGTDPNATREKRKAISKEELKSRIFSSKNNTIENA